MTFIEKGDTIETSGKIRNGAFSIKQDKNSGEYQSFILPNGTAEVLEFFVN